MSPGAGAPAPPPDPLAQGVLRGDRRSVARAITLVESTRADDRGAARRLLAAVAPRTGGALRVGLSGPPGVGKSSLIEALGMHLIARGHRLAVLAIDPSSVRTGGSILGDKTRMGALARAENAFIRPSPAAGTLGGVARRTREALLVCEAAGADVAIVETVGVGQSEVAVAGMTDVFVVMIAPGGGDDLQGVKRGIIELADLLVVNKADGDLRPAAERTRADYAGAVSLLARGDAGAPAVLAVSAREGRGIAELWDAVTARHAALAASGALAARRAAQAEGWMWDEVREGLLDRARHGGGPAAELAARVRRGELVPSAAAAELLEALLAGPAA